MGRKRGVNKNEKKKKTKKQKTNLKITLDCTFYIKSSCLDQKYLIGIKKLILNIKIKIVKEQYKEYNFIRSIDKVDYRYDRKFEGNILIVRRTSCSKTTFVQNLDKNKLFGDVKEVYWISQIELSKDREKNIRDCFVDQTINFDYPNNVEEFNYLLEVYTRKKVNYTENDLGENMILDKVIVTDDASGLTDGSDQFANFQFRKNRD